MIRRQLKESHGIADRRQGSAQLVGKHAKKARGIIVERERSEGEAAPARVEPEAERRAQAQGEG